MNNISETSDSINKQQVIDLIYDCEDEFGKDVIFKLVYYIDQLPSLKHNLCRECKWVQYHGEVDKYGNVESSWFCRTWSDYTDEKGFCHEWKEKNE